MLFKEIIAVYSENRTEPINALCGQNADLVNIKAGVLVSKGLTNADDCHIRILNPHNQSSA
jgi:hypothetical protein